MKEDITDHSTCVPLEHYERMKEIANSALKLAGGHRETAQLLKELLPEEDAQNLSNQLTKDL